MEVGTLPHCQPSWVSSHQTVNTALALRYQGRGHGSRLALLDGDGRLLPGQQPGRPEVVRPHLAVDGPGAGSLEAALQDGDPGVGPGAGQPAGVAPTDGQRLVGGRMTFVGYLDVFPAGRN